MNGWQKLGCIMVLTLASGVSVAEPNEVENSTAQNIKQISAEDEKLAALQKYHQEKIQAYKGHIFLR